MSGDRGARMPRLLATRPAGQQLALMIVPTLLLGVITGVVLDLSAGFYGVLLLAATLGGIAAGLEHATALEGAQRGIVGGLLFGAGVIAGHHLLGRAAKSALPHPEAVEVIITALVSVPLGALGAFIRIRSERRDAVESASAQ